MSSIPTTRRHGATRPLLATLLVAVALALVPAAPVGGAPAQEATTSVNAIAEMTRVVIGDDHACGIDGTGKAWCWGSNNTGQLGDGTVVSTGKLVPTAVATSGTALDGKTVERLAAGWDFTCALATDDTIACWGDNQWGQLGDGTFDDHTSPTAVDTSGTVLAGANVTTITAQHGHVCARTSAGAAACWGLGSVGQLGNGQSSNQTTPVTVTTAGTALAGTTIDDISAGGFTTCVVGANDAVACWGSGSRGGLGNGGTTGSNLAVAPTTAGTPLDGKAIAKVSAGRYSACAVATDGTLACWGAGDDGQLGNGGTSDSLVPTAVTTAGTPLATTTVTGLDSGWDHHCAMTAAGGAVCWGDNLSGQIGDGNPPTDALVPTAVAGTGTLLDGNTVKEIDAGLRGSCAVVNTKEPVCWGYGYILGFGVRPGDGLPRPVAIHPTPPPGAPTITAAIGNEEFASLTWGPVADTGGGAILEFQVKAYDGPTLVETIGFSESSNGPGDGSGNRTFDIAAGTYRFTVAVSNGAGFGPESALSDPVTVTAAPQMESYTPITPCRIMDTRVAGGALGDREIRDVRVTGDGPDFAAQGGLAGGCGIPAEATAIEASVTAVDPSDSGFFRAWPTGESMPNATFMNFDRGMDITNTGSLALAPSTISGAPATTSDVVGDQLRIRSFGGPAHYVIDVQGYFGEDPNLDAGEATTSAVPVLASYYATTPCRIVDTRVAGGSLGDREIRDIAVVGAGPDFAAQGGLAGGCGIPDGALGVEASITAVDPADSGFFRAWPSGQSMPNATFMNFAQGEDLTNTGSLTIATAGPDDLRARNFGGASQYVIDLQGYYLPLPAIG